MPIRVVLETGSYVSDELCDIERLPEQTADVTQLVTVPPVGVVQRGDGDDPRQHVGLFLLQVHEHLEPVDPRQKQVEKNGPVFLMGKLVEGGAAVPGAIACDCLVPEYGLEQQLRGVIILDDEGSGFQGPFATGENMIIVRLRRK